jgi:transposase-like protein
MMLSHREKIMAESILSAPHFHNEEAAYRFVESRVWPRGPVCPHCGGVERNRLMGGESTRIGTYKCYDCRKPFTVKIGTIFESSHIPLRLWLQAIFLIAASKKGISANQLHRTLGVTLKSAWFMAHRVREAMRDGGLTPFGAGGGSVEIDETYIGRDPDKAKARSGPSHKQRVLSLVDRNSGGGRSMVADDMHMKVIMPILRANIANEARILTDGAGYYAPLSLAFGGGHETVDHKRGEYVRLSDSAVHTNTVEGFFSIFKRGMKGIYQHCGKQHLHRYLAEFDFRYSNRTKLGVDDATRAYRLLVGVKGKRLTYRTATH